VYVCSGSGDAPRNNAPVALSEGDIFHLMCHQLLQLQIEFYSLFYGCVPIRPTICYLLCLMLVCLPYKMKLIYICLPIFEEYFGSFVDLKKKSVFHFVERQICEHGTRKKKLCWQYM
jgi:hypothetical protein